MTCRAGQEPELSASRAILHRIRTRKLYKMIDEVLIPRKLVPLLKTVRRLPALAHTRPARRLPDATCRRFRAWISAPACALRLKRALPLR
jgi:hypothetical protein